MVKNNSMKNVLVTGADGFIGSHLTELLLQENYNVRALAYYNSFNRWGWLDDIKHPHLQVETGDVRDPHFCEAIMKSVDIVFHLAALIAIPYSYQTPDSYVDTNVKGTLNICQAAKKNGVKKVLVTSTSEVYGTAQYVPIDEKHPKQPQSPYSASKIGADAMALSFYLSFGLPVVIVRPFNTYGPRQSARAIIPTIISQIASGKKEIKLGNLSPTRDFNFVKDTCRGFLALTDCDGAVGQEVNLCSNSEISMRDTLELIAEITNSNVKFVEDSQRVRPECSEVFRLWGDNSKIKALTGYVPLYSIKQGLEETIMWFCNPENLRKYKSDIYNV
jgi:NAD dependent epimerase/dehydratase